MKRVVTAFILIVLALPSIILAKAPRLKNETKVLELQEPKLAGPLRISPNGNWLIYMRKETLQIPSRDGKKKNRRMIRLVLRNVRSSKERLLPVPACYNSDWLGFYLTGKIFDASRKKIVIPIGVDSDGDGVAIFRKDKMRLALYELASGRIKNLGLSAEILLPMFYQDGHRLFVQVDRKRWFTSPLDQVNFTSVSTIPDRFMVLSISPNGKYAVIFSKYREKYRVRECTLRLLDLRSGKTVRRLPLDKKYWGIYENFAPQWTPNGRYLYYSDSIPSQREGKPKPGTRIWDCLTNKIAGTLIDAWPVGPGPGKSTMLLQDYRGRQPMFLHDADTGRRWVLGDLSKVLLGATGRFVVYAKISGRNIEGIYRAEIDMPGVKPAGAPHRKETSTQAAADKDKDKQDSGARSKLGLAKAYLGAGRKDKAKALLQEVIQKYPKSKEAGEARRLLDKMGG